jgi:hypothetical protein
MTRARDLSKLLGTNNNGVIDNTNITLDANEIPNLDTAKITTGTFASARIDNSSLSAISALPAGVGGKVLQVVQTVKTDVFSSTYNGFIDVTGLSASITPSSSSNKILVISDVAMGHSDFFNFNYIFQTLRNSTAIGISTFASFNASGGANFYNAGGGIYPYVFGNMKMFLDSPATTLSTTYKVQVNKIDASGTIYVNRAGIGTHVGGVSSVTLIEIKG